MNTTLEDLAKERILILDGAMGTMIGELTGKTGNSDELNLTNPELIKEIHRRYLKAGADIITTNTFSSQRISQADYHLETKAREMALEGARIARKCADEFCSSDKPRFVAGSIGPTNKTCSMSPDVSNPALRDLTYDELYEAYFEEADALIEGGVDALLIETIFDTLNAKVALDASIQAMKKHEKQLSLMLSVTVSDLAGRTLSGQTLDAVLASVSTYPIFSIGLNCSFGAKQMLPFLRQLARKAPYYISAYPNAGLPNAMGLYDETAESMAPQMGLMVDEGLVNIIGGCCGTDDHFIEKYPALVEGKQPRKPAEKPETMWLSGLDMLDVTKDVHFVNVGERCNVAGSRKFLRLIKEKQYDEAVSIARKQVADGALVIDINMDDGLLDARQEMVNFLNMIAAEPDIASVPVMLDSSDWNVIVSGLKCVQGKSIVNSISLKEGEEVFIKHAMDVKRYGAAVVVMCFDEEGQATSYDRRIQIAKRAYHILTQQVGMNPLDIIFDPNILAVATGMPEHDAYAADFIRATQWIRENLPGAHVSGGVSNLSFSFRGNNYIREAMHAVFLYHAIQSGMDFGIVNPATKVLYTDIPQDQLEIIEDVILNRKPNAAERLIALAAELADDSNKSGDTAQSFRPNETRTGSVEERLQQALIKGVGDYLQEDLEEALKKYPKAVNIIEGPLMTGMNQVGELFGAGKMFLPQVVKTARTMKQAVAILQPYIEADQSEGAKKAGKVLLATVKGDVHDIGKNIVKVLWENYGYHVVDLGKDVPAESVVEAVEKHHAKLVGLTALMTTTVAAMEDTITALRRKTNTNILVGGAVMTQEYADTIGADGYAPDAVAAVDYANRVFQK